MSLDATAYFKSKPLIAALRSLSGQDWTITFDGPFKIVAADIDASLLPYVRGSRCTIEISLEGRRTPASLSAFAKVTNDFVREFGGLVHNKEIDSLVYERGTVPILRIAEEGKSKSHSLGIFFENAHEVSKDKMSQILDIIEKEIPEALPHRYGSFEPLQERWSFGGKDRFLELWKRIDAPFACGKPPVCHINMSFDYHLGRDLGEFRCGEIEFCFKKSVLSLPSKYEGILRMAEQIVPLLNPFYVCFVEEAGLYGPRWKGAPNVPHYFLVLGEPLLSIWQGFVSLSVPLGKKHRVFRASREMPFVIPPAEIQVPLKRNHYFNGGQNGEPALRPSGQYAQIFPFPKRDPYWPIS